MQAKISRANSRLSALKVQLEEKEAALANATEGLTEHRQNLTKASIRANESETENALMQAMIAKANSRLTALKVQLEEKEAALVNATKELTHNAKYDLNITSDNRLADLKKKVKDWNKNITKVIKEKDEKLKRTEVLLNKTDNSLSVLKKNVNIWKKKVIKISKEKDKNLTTTEGLLNQSETENAAYRSKIIKDENKFSVLKKRVKDWQNNLVKIS